MAEVPEGGRIKCPKCGQVFVLRRRRAAPARSPTPPPASPPPLPGLALNTEVAGHKVLEYVAHYYGIEFTVFKGQCIIPQVISGIINAVSFEFIPKVLAGCVFFDVCCGNTKSKF